MSTRASSTGARSRPAQVHAIHFDRLMEAVTSERKVAHEAAGEGRRPGSARAGLREPLSPVGNTRHSRIRLNSARPSLPSSGGATPRAQVTPREIMAAAVQELPSLTNTLQDGKWITAQVAAGALLFTLWGLFPSQKFTATFCALTADTGAGVGNRMPSAPSAQRPPSSRPASAVAASARPLSARPNGTARSALVGAELPASTELSSRPNGRPQGIQRQPGWQEFHNPHPHESSSLLAAHGEATGDAQNRRDARQGMGETSATHKSWAECCGNEHSAAGFLSIVQELCSLGKSSKTDTAIARTREIVRNGLDCEGCSVFVVMNENRLVRNSLSAKELPETNGVVGRVVQRMEDMVNVDREDTCNFFDQRVDRDPDLKTRMGKGLLAQGVFSSTGQLLGVILAIGKLHGQSFGKTDETILKTIAMQVGMILGLCKTVRKMENTFKEGERDIRFAKALNECRTSDSVLTLAQQYFSEITGANQVRFFDAEIFAPSQVSDGLLDPYKAQPLETAARAFKSGRMFLIEDMSSNDQYSRIRQEHEFAKSVMSIPMRVGQNGKILGVLQGMHSDAFTFSRKQCEQMEPMLFMMTKVLERTQMSDNTLKLQTKLPKVFITRDVRDAIFVVEGVAREVLSAQAACVFILNQTDKKTWTVHPTSSEREEFDSELGIVGDCISRNELIQVPNALKDPRYFDPIDGTKCLDLGTQYRHMMLAPIRAMQDKRLLGVIAISRDQNQAFSHTDENFAKVIAITLAAAFEVCMENEIFEVALKDNRNIMRLVATIHHKHQISDLARATIVGTMEAMQASECLILLKAETNAYVYKGKDEVDISRVKLRKFSLLDGKLEDDVVQWDDAVIEQSIINGMMVNVTSQRMLNHIGYKRLHRLSAMSGSKILSSQIDRDPEELLLGPTMCSPLFTGLDRGHVFGCIQIRRSHKAEVFTESEEQKFRYFCQHTSSAFRRTFEREKLVAMIEKHENNIRRNAVLSTFLEKIQDSTDLPAVARQIVNAAKKIGFCAGANFYRIEKNAASEEAFLNVSVVLTDTEGEHFVTQIRMGTEIHEKRLDIGRGIPGEVRRQGLAVIVNQPSTTAFFDAEVDEPRDGGNCRNALGVPVFSKEDPSRVIAVLVLFNSLQTTEKGLSDRDFDLEDIDRLHNFAEWIAILLRVPRDIQVPLTTINTILSSVMEGSLGNKVLQEHSKTQESLFLQRQTLNPNLKQFPSREFTFLQRSASWQAISDSITAYTSCQALVAFQLVSGEENSLQCIYPTASAGHRLHVPAGIMKEAMDSKCIVNIQNSEEDPRVSRKYDTYDFLNMQWDTGTVGMLSPICERYGDGKLSVRSALHSAHTQGPGIRLDWKNAVVVPMLDRHGAVTGLVLAINKPAYKGWFTKEDEYFVKTLSMMAGLEDILKNTQGDLNNAVSLRRNFIKDAADCIYRSSQNITSTKAFVDDALTSILRATKAHYGAVYLIHPRAEGQATKYDSLGSVSNEKRKKSLPWTVMETGSPINLASASDLEASQVIPAGHDMGSLRSIMAEPLIIENEIVGVVLVAWKTNCEPFDQQDENALHDFSVLFGSTQRLLHCVEELVNVIELEMAIPAHSIPALSALGIVSPGGEKATASTGIKKTTLKRQSTTL